MADALTGPRRESDTTARPRAVVSLAVVLAYVLGQALVTAAPAGAHEVDQRVRAVVTEVTVDLPGLVVEVGRSVADQVLVTNPSGTELEILDGDGRAFLRIGPDGVLGDLETAAFFLSNDPFGSAPVPSTADGEEPRWGRVSRDPSWGWFDHRLHPVQRLAPPSDAQPGDVLATWSVPVRAGGQRGELRGQVEFVPVLGAYVASLDGGPVTDEDFTAAVLGGPVPAILVENRGRRPVVVLGPDGEPFLRVAPTGVDANLHSPWWHQVARLEVGHARPDLDPDPTAEPAWEPVADVPRFAWLELRAHVPDAQPDDPTARQVARQWTVPVRVGDRQVELAGRTEWVPTGAADDGGSGPLLPVAGLLLALVLAALAVRRRGRGDDAAGAQDRPRASAS